MVFKQVNYGDTFFSMIALPLLKNETRKIIFTGTYIPTEIIFLEPELSSLGDSKWTRRCFAYQ